MKTDNNLYYIENKSHIRIAVNENGHVLMMYNPNDEDLQKTIDSIGEELAELNSANIRDFHPSGDDRPKTAAVYDKIFGLAKEKNLSFAARKELSL